MIHFSPQGKVPCRIGLSPSDSGGSDHVQEPFILFIYDYRYRCMLYYDILQFILQQNLHIGKGLGKGPWLLIFSQIFHPTTENALYISQG